MNSNDDYKPTEYFNPQQYGQQPSSSDWGQSNMSPPVGGSSHQKTEVLRPVGPKVTAMLVGIDGAPGIIDKIFRLDPRETTAIGRDYTCEIVIDESSVSRQHAKVRFEQQDSGELRFFIQDLATENGTEVNGETIIKHYLNDGDEVKLGRTRFIFKQIDLS